MPSSLARDFGTLARRFAILFNSQVLKQFAFDFPFIFIVHNSARENQSQQPVEKAIKVAHQSTPSEANEQTNESRNMSNQ